MSQSDDSEILRIADADCKTVLDEIPVEMISLAGVEKSIENMILDLVYGMSISCADAFSLILQNTSSDEFYILCLNAELYGSAWI